MHTDTMSRIRGYKRWWYLTNVCGYWTSRPRKINNCTDTHWRWPQASGPSHSTPQCNGIPKVTLAYKLAVSIPLLQDLIKDTFSMDPSIPSKSPTVQWVKLIDQPLLAITPDFTNSCYHQHAGCVQRLEWGTKAHWDFDSNGSWLLCIYSSPVSWRIILGMRFAEQGTKLKTCQLAFKSCRRFDRLKRMRWRDLFLVSLHIREFNFDTFRSKLVLPM